WNLSCHGDAVFWRIGESHVFEMLIEILSLNARCHRWAPSFFSDDAIGHRVGKFQRFTRCMELAHHVWGDGDGPAYREVVRNLCDFARDHFSEILICSASNFYCMVIEKLLECFQL